MAETQSLVRDRGLARIAKAGIGLAILIATLFGFLAACVTPATLGALELETSVMPNIDLENNRMISFDGAELGLTVWDTEQAPEIVIVGVHGMNDYANAFHMAAPYWAAARPPVPTRAAMKVWTNTRHHEVSPMYLASIFDSREEPLDPGRIGAGTAEGCPAPRAAPR